MSTGRGRATAESSLPLTLALARTWPKRRLALVPEVSTMGSAVTWLAARDGIKVDWCGVTTGVRTYRSYQRPQPGRARMRDACSSLVSRIWTCKEWHEEEKLGGTCDGVDSQPFKRKCVLCLAWPIFYTPQRSHVCRGRQVVHQSVTLSFSYFIYCPLVDMLLLFF